MGKLNQELKNKLTFERSERIGEEYGNVIIYTMYKGVYRQYMYFEAQNATHADKARQEEFAKNVLTHYIERALIEKGESA